MTILDDTITYTNEVCKRQHNNIWWFDHLHKWSVSSDVNSPISLGMEEVRLLEPSVFEQKYDK